MGSERDDVMLQRARASDAFRVAVQRQRQWCDKCAPVCVAVAVPKLRPAQHCVI